MKKFVSLFLALLTVLSLVACGSKTDTKTDDKSGGSTVTEPANALEKIKADGVLTVALSPDFSPMEFVDSSKIDQDQYVGFDVTLAKYIADGLGVKLQIEAMGFDASQTAVYTGSVPMSISGYSWTEERAKNYELSDYYYAGENETRQALLVKKENADKYTTPETLSGKDVGAQNASLQMQLVTEQLTGANPISMQTSHFNDFLMPLYQGPAFNAGSTDVGDVSYQCPTAQIHVAVWPNNVPCHTWQVVSCNKTPLAHKATVHAGKVLCAAAIDLLEQPELLEKAKAEFTQRTAGGYTCPIPADAVAAPLDL